MQSGVREVLQHVRKPTAVLRLFQKAPQTRWTGPRIAPARSANATTHADTGCRNPKRRGTGSVNATTRILAFLAGWDSGCFDYDCSEAAGATDGVGKIKKSPYCLTAFRRVKENRAKTPEIAGNWRNFATGFGTFALPA